jgi:acetyl esterase/lipase
MEKRNMRKQTESMPFRQRVKSSLKLLAVMMMCIAPQTLAAQAAEPTGKRLLWQDGAPGALGTEDKDKPMAMVYLPKDKSESPRPALVICPGGGYGGLAIDHEGYQIADWANSLGMVAVICEYRHRGKGYGHPAPLQDAQRAIRMTRANAKEWNVDQNKVGIIGFSAGGHLVSTVLTHFDAGDQNAQDAIARQSSRPDFGILSYAVIGFDKPYTHRGSQQNLLGNNPDPKLVESLSNESQVTKDTPPTFVWHTFEDTVVPPENAVQFYLGMIHHGVPGELHVYEKGRHGVGLGRDVPVTSTWSDLCQRWLVARGMLAK